VWRLDAAQQVSDQQNNIGNEENQEGADPVQQGDVAIDRQYRDDGQQNRNDEGRDCWGREVKAPVGPCIGHGQIPLL
jgi:hypothetical protein